MQRYHRFLTLGICAAILASGTAALAYSDEAPTPRKSPRTPVSREVLMERKGLPTSRTVTGNATIVDTERLRFSDVEVRLFGVVPPQLSASYGPQARAVLDQLNAGTGLTCKVRDRNREGHYLASCTGTNGADLGLELLRRGLAATARGSLRGTELETNYMAAEAAAKSQRLGIWSVTLPAAVSDSSLKDATQKEEAAKIAAAAAAIEALHITEKAEKQTEEPAPKPAVKPEVPIAAQVPAVTTTPAATAKAIKDAPSVLLPASDLDVDSGELEDPLPAQTESQAPAMERYQLLITGILMLLTALGVMGAVVLHRFLDKREERRSIAAALRGELMAARSLCVARLNAMGENEKTTAWPRIRTLVFQAYVGRLGYLGAELARQIASIYGQASDYAAYYATEGKEATLSKKQPLQALIQHIDDVLPRLAFLEGTAPAFPVPSFPLSSSHPKQDQTKNDTPPSPDGGPGGGTKIDKPSIVKSAAVIEQLKRHIPSKPSFRQSAAAKAPSLPPAGPEPFPEEKDLRLSAEATKEAQQTEVKTPQTLSLPTSASDKPAPEKEIAPEAASSSSYGETLLKEDPAPEIETSAAERALAQVQEEALAVAKEKEGPQIWRALRRLTGTPRRHRDPMEAHLPDYASMSEEELEIMAYNMGYGLDALDEETPENAAPKSSAAG